MRVAAALIALVALAASAACGGSGSGGGADAKPTIVFGDLNWDSALFQTRVAQYVVEHGYGYPTETRFGTTLPLVQGLRRGDIQLHMEFWLPNLTEAWEEAQASGEIVSAGTSLGSDWQSAFVIPRYLQEQYPELDSIEDLREDRFKELFAAVDTHGKARLVSCVSGWACEEVNAQQIAGYGLGDHVEIVVPGDLAALNADLYGAYSRREPWLGFQYGTNTPALVLDLVRLEEPPYSDECWHTTKACAYEDATVLIAAHPDMPAIAPDVMAMLRRWEFGVGVYKGVARWQRDRDGAGPEDAALWWLSGNEDVWGGWVTPEAAAGIREALARGERAAGWPAG